MLKRLVWAAFLLISLHFLVVLSLRKLGSFLPLKGIWHRIVLPSCGLMGFNCWSLQQSLLNHFLSFYPVGRWESLLAWAPTPTRTMAPCWGFRLFPLSTYDVAILFLLRWDLCLHSWYRWADSFKNSLLEESLLGLSGLWGCLDDMNQIIARVFRPSDLLCCL